jgi:AcrR family transcriptional regulator
MARRAWGAAVQDKEEQHRLKKQAVLQAAASTIREKGYSQTTLADVAAALHVSKPSLYYYFKSKDQIMFEIQHLAIDMVLDINPSDLDSPFLPGLAVPDRLSRFVRRYVRMITSDYGACLIMTPRQALEPDTRKRLVGAVRPIDQVMRNIIEDGVNEGLFAPSDVRLATSFVFGSLNWIPYWFRSDGPASVEQVTVAATAHVMNALRSPEPVLRGGVARSRA